LSPEYTSWSHHHTTSGFSSFLISYSGCLVEAEGISVGYIIPKFSAGSDVDPSTLFPQVFSGSYNCTPLPVFTMFQNIKDM